MDLEPGFSRIVNIVVGLTVLAAGWGLVVLTAKYFLYFG